MKSREREGSLHPGFLPEILKNIEGVYRLHAAGTFVMSCVHFARLFFVIVVQICFVLASSAVGLPLLLLLK